MSLIQAFPYGGNGGGTAGVASFNNRTGHVVPQDGDYTKANVGLGNVDNTSDLDKPISTATQEALDDKINITEKGSINGLATLGSDGKIPTNQLPDNTIILTGTLVRTDWNNKTQTVVVSGINNTLKGIIGMLDTATDAQLEAAADADLIVNEIGTNSITFTCENIPSIDIPFGVLISGNGDLNTGFLYSGEEHIAGTYVNISTGKKQPIYEMTAGITYNSLINEGEYTIMQLPSDCKKVISLEGTFEQFANATDTVPTHIRPFPYQNSYGYTMILDYQPNNDRAVKIYKTGNWITGNAIVTARYILTD